MNWHNFLRGGRQAVNTISVRFDLWRQRNRAYRARTLLVANHWDGSVQQFYHFFLGYYLPVCQWMKDHPGQPVVVRDCGPMNVWFEALQDNHELEIVPPGSALHMVVGRRLQHRVLRGLDDPNTFDARRIRRGAQAVAALLGVERTPVGSGDKLTLIVDRASSESFYQRRESETHMSGQERRSIPNLFELPRMLDEATAPTLVDLAQIAPRDQIAIAGRASTLIGQHGAGLAHMIWMTHPAKIIEIAPPLPPQVDSLFEQLARALGHSHYRIFQDHTHASIDLVSVASLVRRQLAQ